MYLHSVVKVYNTCVISGFNSLIQYETWIVVVGTVLVVGLTLIFLHKMSRYSSIFNKRKKMKYKNILETKGKLADVRANPHMLHTYGYMLNQGNFNRFYFFSYICPLKMYILNLLLIMR